MRHSRIAIALATLSLSLGGCATLGLGDAPGGATGGGSAATGDSWVMVEAGKATPSPTPKQGRAPSASPEPTLPPYSPDPGCTRIWPRTPRAFIPIVVTPGAGSFKVEWPRQYDSDYRITAVPQPLVYGDQPEPAWKAVPAGTGCTITATLTGLTPGKAYIVWLDAPNSGREIDGRRHLYSGRSGVVYPR